MTCRIERPEELARDAASFVGLLSEHDLLGVSVSHFSRDAVAPTPPLHVHGAHAEAFLVLDGSVRFVLESGDVTAGAGSFVTVPRGVVHTFRLDTEATFLDLHAPSCAYASFVRTLSSATDEQELARAREAFDQQPPPESGAGDGRALVSRIGGVDGERIADDPERRVRLLVDEDDLAVTDSLYGPGMRGPELHVHHDHVDAFVVTAGELTFAFGTGSTQVPAGTFVLVPPGVAHSFHNSGAGEARFLNVHAPSCGFGEYLRGRNPGFDQHPASGNDTFDARGVILRALDDADTRRRIGIASSR